MELCLVTLILGFTGIQKLVRGANTFFLHKAEGIVAKLDSIAVSLFDWSEEIENMSLSCNIEDLA